MLATVASINSANRLKKYLFDKYSVSVRIIQTPSSLTKDGCGYSLRLNDREKNLVASAAGELRINIRSFFKEKKTSSGTEYEKL